MSCRVTSWANKVNFPYTLNSSFNDGYGWYDESGMGYSDKNCDNPGPNCTQHASDWNAANNTANWIKEVTKSNPDQPFLAYWGSYIVHPPYGTTTYWLDTVNQSMVIAPKWIDKDKMHPEDFQSSMKKKFFGP